MGKRRPPASPRGFEQAVLGYLGGCRECGRQPTWTGLALELGYPGREGLDSLAAGTGPLAQAARRARSLIEEANLQALYCRESATGAKFVLQCQFGYGEGRPLPAGPITVRVEGEEV